VIDGAKNLGLSEVKKSVDIIYSSRLPRTVVIYLSVKYPGLRLLRNFDHVTFAIAAKVTKRSSPAKGALLSR